VLLSSLSLLLLFWQWRPIPYHVRSVSANSSIVALTVLFWIGWSLVLLSASLIDHWDLFGLRQVYLCLRGIEYTPVAFRQPALYKYVRHPLMLGFLLAFWVTPDMSVGHLIFAAGMTVYILIGVSLEERDLVKAYGLAYEHYRQRVPMLLPRPWRK
jgi:protein-S-isoprenylcysteine O-methyltransferase Ste14